MLCHVEGEAGVFLAALPRWYHGMLSRVEGEGVLRAHSEGSYLVRATTDTGKCGEYSLGIK